MDGSTFHAGVPRPTVVLLHSSASSARQWDALIRLLQPRFRVHAIDLHGHGAQPRWQGAAPFALADDAALVAPLLADAGSVHLVGHSYGAAVALKAASLHPHRVCSLVAYEPVLFRWLIEEQPRPDATWDAIAIAEAVRNRMARNREDLAAQCFIDYWSGPGAWDAVPETRRISISGRMRSILQQFDALIREPLSRADVAALRMPALFLSGAHTVRATRHLAQRLRAALPAASHVVLPDMGHMGPITHADEVNRSIVRFLAAHAAGAPCAPLDAAV